MIAQELSLLLLDRGSPPASLSLVCTHSGGWRLLPPLSSFPMLLRVALSVSASARIRRILPLHYAPEYLASMLECEEEEEPVWSAGSVLAGVYEERSPFMRSILHYIPGVVGHLLAALTHHVSGGRLSRLGSDAAAPDCLVVAAGMDKLIPKCHSLDLARRIGGACAAPFCLVSRDA